MNGDWFRRWSRKASDWGADYRARLATLPVRAQVEPGQIASQIGPAAPEKGEPMEEIFADFERIIVPGMTHWQHPRFLAYFPANSAPVSVIAEYLVTAMAAQCMLWQTSPAATELETKVMDWLRQALGLPDGFDGVLQDSASTATLAAVLTMRERALEWQGNLKGLASGRTVRIYSSNEVHTSIDRAIWIAGIGQENLVRIATRGQRRSMDAAALEAAIVEDRSKGLLPAGIIACVGGTGVGGTDDVAAVCDVAERHGLMVHVDAAWAGSAMICPEFRHLWAGVERAHSVVFNPHKWLGAQFDCAAHFVRNPDELVRTLAIRPAYLETHGKSDIINYSEWSVPLGRRFRALKLWFLLRAHGLEGLRQMIRNHVQWTSQFAERLRAEADFEIASEPVLSLFSFRYLGQNGKNLDELNQRLINKINDEGIIYLTQTMLDGRFVIRVSVGQFETSAADLDVAFNTIVTTARELQSE
ncbi:MAG: pyridoxal-dependent decarboxylase [Rhizobiaceae bacterium]